MGSKEHTMTNTEQIMDFGFFLVIATILSPAVLALIAIVAKGER